MKIIIVLVLCLVFVAGQHNDLHHAAGKITGKYVKNVIDEHRNDKKLDELEDKLSHHNEDGYTPLHVAASNNNVQAAKALIRAGADLKALTKDDEQLTPLQVAAATGHTHVLDLLLNKGGRIDHVNPSGQTALHLGAYFGHGYVVQHLLKAGADWNLKSSTGNTPLHYACTRGFDRPIKFLMEHWPNLNTRNNLNETPLMAAAEKGCTKCVNEIISRLGKNETYTNEVGDLLLEVDPAGETALHKAARGGHDRVVWLLSSYFLKANKNKASALAYYNQQNAVGKTPLWLASENHFHRAMFMLLQLGADETIKSNEGVSVREAAYLHPVTVEFKTHRELAEDEEDENVDEDGNPLPVGDANPSINVLDAWAETIKRRALAAVEDARKAAEKDGKLEL